MTVEELYKYCCELGVEKDDLVVHAFAENFYVDKERIDTVFGNVEIVV